MMRSWEEEVKFIFPNTEEEYLYEVAVPGARDNEEANVEDGYHTMKRYDLLLEHSALYITDRRIQIQ